MPLVPLVPESTPEPVPDDVVPGELLESIELPVAPLLSVVDPVGVLPMLPVLPVPELMPEDIPLVPVDASVDVVPAGGEVLLPMPLVDPVEELEGKLLVDELEGIADGVVVVVVVVVLDVPGPDERPKVTSSWRLHAVVSMTEPSAAARSDSLNIDCEFLMKTSSSRPIHAGGMHGERWAGASRSGVRSLRNQHVRAVGTPVVQRSICRRGKKSASSE